MSKAQTGLVKPKGNCPHCHRLMSRSNLPMHIRSCLKGPDADKIANERKMRTAYDVQRNNSIRVRKIEWQFDYPQWKAMWLESGKWELRGKKLGQFCMSRFNDTGPYSPSNCFIQLHQQNSIDGNLGTSKPAISKALRGTTRPQHVKDAIGAANRLTKRSPEVRQRMSAAQTGLQRQRLPCPHCQQETASNNLNRHAKVCEANPERTRITYKTKKQGFIKTPQEKELI